jgi:hypothetical protein
LPSSRNVRDRGDGRASHGGSATAAAGRSLPAGNFNPRITETFFYA